MTAAKMLTRSTRHMPDVQKCVDHVTFVSSHAAQRKRFEDVPWMVRFTH